MKKKASKKAAKKKGGAAKKKASKKAPASQAPKAEEPTDVRTASVEELRRIVADPKQSAITIAQAKNALKAVEGWVATPEELAGLFDVTVQTVKRWPLREVAKGRFDLREAIRYRTRSQGDEKAPDEDQLLKRARREHLELKTGMIRGELIPLEVVESIWTEQLSYQRAALDSMPARAARELCAEFGIPDQVQVEELISRFRFEALQALAAFDESEYRRKSGAAVARLREELEEESDGGGRRGRPRKRK